jgi:acyl CoA:acetate/3-ketoacid CoA transferase beta subunit
MFRFLNHAPNRRKVSKVVTDQAIMSFDPQTKEMTLEQPQPGVDVSEVQQATVIDLIKADLVDAGSPSEEEHRVLRVLNPE